MRNFYQLAMALVIGGSSLFFSSPALANGSVTPGVSFTHRIVNPGFDKNTAEGWTSEGKGPATAFTVMEVYNGTFNIFQTVTGLPNGPYELRASAFHRAKANDGGSAYNGGTEVINAALYASTTEETQETVVPSLYSETGVTVSGGGKLLNGYVDNMEGAYQAFSAGYYSNVTVKITVTDGSVTIGMKTLGNNVDRSWTIWDNFQLVYVGEGNLDVYWEMIDQIDIRLADYINEGLIPSGILRDIEKIQALREEYINTEDKEELQILLDSYRETEIKAGYAALVMDSLYTQINLAAAYENENYPGKEALSEARIKATLLTYDDGTTLVYAEDLSLAIIQLKAAILTYRFSQAIPAQGLDCTWAMKAPNFTKEGEDQSVFENASSEGWKTDNVPAENAQYRLNKVNGKNCWNNYNGNFTRMNVFQDLENLPAGLYSFSCYQTNDGPEITDQHPYSTAIGGTSVSDTATYSFAFNTDPEKGSFADSSKWEGPLSSGKVLVGTDGKLRVGFASTSNKNGTSGWFCITDCQLTYYGMPEGAFAEAMKTMIGKAKELESAEILPMDAKALNNGIKAAESVDTSDNDVAEAGLLALRQVITTAESAIEELAVFKNDIYADVLAVTEDEEDVYSEEIKNFASGLIATTDASLKKETASTAILPSLTTQIKECLALIPLVQKTEGVIANNLYDQDARTELDKILKEQLGVVKADFSKAAEVARFIDYKMKMTMLAQPIDPVTGADVTIWIVNPDFEDSVADNGWDNDGFGVTTGLPSRDDLYSGNAFETWIQRNNRLTDKTFSQTLYVPNGEYVISVRATACQQGKIMFYEEDGTTKKDSVIITTPVKGFWLFGNKDSIEIATPMIGDSEPYENQVATNEPRSKVFDLNRVTVTDNSLTLGVKTRSTTANWVAFDNFKLACLSYAVGIEDVNADQSIPMVYVENGLIKVVGTDQFSIYTLNGFEVPVNTPLVSGIYIVKVNSQVIKVMVK